VVRLADLRGEKMLLLKESHCFRDDALRICTRARTPFHPMFETDQFSSIFPMVASGLGITLERETFRRVSYIRVRRHATGAAQSAFVKWLREWARTPPPPPPGERRDRAPSTRTE
jgi:LysR family hydrogen peroxide-inducible transcriptional activator